MRAIGSDPPCYPRQPSNPHACRDHPREPLVKKSILLYGLLGGVLIAVLKIDGYRYLVLEHSLELCSGSSGPGSKWYTTPITCATAPASSTAGSWRCCSRCWPSGSGRS